MQCVRVTRGAAEKYGEGCTLDPINYTDPDPVPVSNPVFLYQCPILFHMDPHPDLVAWFIWIQSFLTWLEISVKKIILGSGSVTLQGSVRTGVFLTLRCSPPLCCGFLPFVQNLFRNQYLNIFILSKPFICKCPYNFFFKKFRFTPS